MVLAADGALLRRRVEERGREGERQEEDGDVQQGEEAQRGQQGRPAPALHQGPHRDRHPEVDNVINVRSVGRVGFCFSDFALRVAA